MWRHFQIFFSKGKLNFWITFSLHKFQDKNCINIINNNININSININSNNINSKKIKINSNKIKINSNNK